MKISLLVLTLAFLSACAKVGYDSRVPATPLAQSEPPAEQKGKVAPAPTIKQLPIVKFVQNSVVMNTKLEAEIELQLSQASAVPVVVDVKLVNGSAVHHRDFSGYKTPSPNNETKQTLIFAPGTTSLKLPKIGGRNTFYCDTDFTAEIDILSLQNATVTKGTNTVVISLPCNIMN